MLYEPEAVGLTGRRVGSALRRECWDNGVMRLMI
jgi:hypothetical protein